MNTCLHCRHWQFSETDRSGGRVPGWMIRHGMAACALGRPWTALPGRRVCDKGRFAGLPEGDVQKRVMWLEKNANG